MPAEQADPRLCQSNLLACYQAAVARTDDLIDPSPPRGRTLAEIRARAEARLARLRAFLAHLGDPHERYPIVHVGGTSGKGSTSAAIAAILSAAGYRTGLHTSPYLQVATEKLQLDGRLIAADAFADLVDDVLGAAETWCRPRGERLSYGEVWFALLATWFARERVDAAVIEVGAGGRFDLTNVVRPAVSVITSVGLDHTETLGPTIAEIAWHKAGIVKPGVPVVTAETNPEALAPIVAEASASGSDLIRVVPGKTFRVVARDAGAVRWQDERGLEFSTAMPGRFQATNMATAVTAVRALEQAGFVISEIALRSGLANARLPGRLETVQQVPRIILDGAHNQQKIGALVADLPDTLRLPSAGRLVVVLGVLEAKDHVEIVRQLAPHVSALIATSPRVLAKSGLSASALATAAQRSGVAGPIVCEDDPLAAIDRALGLADATRGDAVLVTGSLYLVGNVRARWYPDEAIVLQRTPWPVGVAADPCAPFPQGA